MKITSNIYSLKNMFFLESYKLFYVFLILLLFSCNTITNNPNDSNDQNCMPNVSVKKNSFKNYVEKEFGKTPETEGMVLIKGGEFEMGSDNNQAKQDEFPKHKVFVNSFWMDITEVTNNQFQKFIDQTGYITTAERPIDWNEIKKILPPGTPKPHDSLMAPASLVFLQTQAYNLNDHSQWWILKKNANWKQPLGDKSNIIGKGDHPVVHISWEDALAYCKWAGKRLPTEAEFEYASRGGLKNNTYSWGNEPVFEGKTKANIWEGKFPSQNTVSDKYYYTAPVGSFPPNSYGLYDIGGNVWEWCSDWYSSNYYSENYPNVSNNPKGPMKSYDPIEPFTPKKVMRGGSFLCNDSYCSGYRNSMRMKSSPDSSLIHAGFRTVVDVK